MTGDNGKNGFDKPAGFLKIRARLLRFGDKPLPE
jgi:hypothetical protein